MTVLVAPPAKAAEVATGPGGLFVPAQQRILDSTSTTGGLNDQQLANNTWYEIPVASALGVAPADLSSVQVTFTVLGAAADGLIFADKSGITAGRSTVPLVTFMANSHVSNTATLAVGTNGNIQVMSNHTTDLVIDVQGYYSSGETAAGGFVALSPQQIYNSGATRFGDGTTRAVTFNATNVAGVPSNATAVMLSVTEANNGGGSGYLSVYPAGSSPTTSLQWPSGANYEWTQAVQVGTGGQVTVNVRGGGPVQLSVGVQGYFTANQGQPQSGAFTPASAKVLDTRDTGGTRIAPNSTRTIQVTGVNGIPQIQTGLSAAALDLELFPTSSAQGHVNVFPADETQGTDTQQYYASTMTFAFVVAKLSKTGAIKITNNSTGSVDLAIYTEGWYNALPTGPATDTGLTGARPSQTATKFSVSDQVQASVDVGTGNLQVSTSGLSLRGVNSDVSIGATYNSFGWQEAVTGGPLANKWTNAYASAGSLSGTAGGVVYTGADGSTWPFTATATGTYTAPHGFKQSLEQITEPGTTNTNYKLTDLTSRQVIVFDAHGNATSVTDRNGNVTKITYPQGLPTTVVTAAGPTAARTATIGYNTGNRTLTISQTNGSSTRSITYVKDTAGNLVSFTNATGAVTSFAYSGDRLVTITGPTGQTTQITYQADRPKVTRVTQSNTTTGSAGAATTRFSYTSSTQTLVAGPNTDLSQSTTVVPRTTYKINPDTFLVENAKDPIGRERSATYTDDMDVMTATTGVDGGQDTGTSKGTYNANNKQSLTNTESPEGSTGSAEYGDTEATAYLQRTSTDDAGNQSTSTFNGPGNQTSSSNAMAQKAEVDYNDDGDNTDGTVQSATTPGNGTNRTFYTYDANHQLTQITPPTGTSLNAQKFSYDAFGRTKVHTDGRGGSTTYTYDNADRLLTTVFSDGTPTVTNTYDATGNTLTSQSASGTITNVYDQAGQLISTVNTAGGGTIRFGYDKAGNQTTKTNSAGTTTSTYDSSNKLQGMEYPTAGGATQKVTFKIDDNGRRTDQWMNANAIGIGAPATWSVHTLTKYDKSDRVTRVQVSTSTNGGMSGSLVFDTSYCYNVGAKAPTCGTVKANDRKKLQFQVNNLTTQATEYKYEKGNRLESATQSGGNANTHNTTWSYEYNERGDRIKASTSVDGATATTQSIAYNAASQITNSGWTYDGDGNVIAAPGQTFQYNGAQQLVRSTKNGVVTTYTYAGADQNSLLSETVGGVEHKYVYGTGIDSYTVGGATSRPVVDTSTGQALALISSTGTTGLYVYDGIGNQIGMSTDMGAEAWSTSYDPYGQFADTDVQVAALNDQNPYGFKAGTSGNGNGLMKFGYRWYNAETGAWMQRDTLDVPLDPANGNRYGYAGDDPINNADPGGRISIPFTGLQKLFSAGTLLYDTASVLEGGNSLLGFTAGFVTELACGAIVSAVGLGTGGAGFFLGVVCFAIGNAVGNKVDSAIGYEGP